MPFHQTTLLEGVKREEPRSGPRLLTAPDSAVFLTGGAAMGALMRTLDWSRSPLGVPAGWPIGLRSVVSVCLGSPVPMLIGWGPGLCVLCNDACLPLLGANGPLRILGRPLPTCRDQLPHQLEAVFDRVQQSAHPLSCRLDGTSFDLLASPIRTETEEVDGVLALFIARGRFLER